MLKLKVLIVENTPGDLELLEAILKANHSNIISSYSVATSYDEALKILSKEDNFDLSILDIKLDGHKSYELIDGFNKSKFGLIAFMTILEEIPKNILRKAQPVLTIEKPFDETQIADFISEVHRLKKTNNSPTHQVQKTDGETIFITEDQVYYIESAKRGKHSLVHYYDKVAQAEDSFESTSSIAALLSELTPEHFAKCNNGCVVNVLHVRGTYKPKSELTFDNPIFANVVYSPVFLDDITRKKLNA